MRLSVSHCHARILVSFSGHCTPPTASGQPVVAEIHGAFVLHARFGVYGDTKGYPLPLQGLTGIHFAVV